MISTLQTPYVLALLYNGDTRACVFVQKLHGPLHMRGKFNGPGGKVEKGESPLQAVKREVYEEVGLNLPEDRYDHIITSHGNDEISPWRMHIFRAFLRASEFHPMALTDEGMYVFSLDDLPYPQLVPNLAWMVHFGWNPTVRLPLLLEDHTA